MSSSKGPRRRCLTLALAGLVALGQTGCNLRPLYGGSTGAATIRELATIDVRVAPTPLAQYLANEIEDALNPDGLRLEKTYELIVEPEIYISDLAVQLQGTATRRDLYLLASFALRRKGQAQPAYVSASRRVASYNVPSQPYAELAARQDAERRAAVELGQDIRTRLALFFADNAT